MRYFVRLRVSYLLEAVFTAAHATFLPCYDFSPSPAAPLLHRDLQS